MKKLDYIKVNRSNNDIWMILNEAVKTGNNAIIQANLIRLYKLQKYYIDRIFFLEVENASLKDLYSCEQELNRELQKDIFIEIAKRNGIYEKIKSRIEEL